MLAIILLNMEYRDVMFEIGIWDLTPFEIGMLGFQDPPLQTPKNRRAEWKGP